MFTYVALIKLTPEGRESLTEAPKYLDRFKRLIEEQKGTLEQTFAMMGPYDFVSIVEYPTVEAAFKAHGKIATLEAIEVETYPVEQVETFLKALV